MSNAQSEILSRLEAISWNALCTKRELEALLKDERNRTIEECARRVENGRFLHDEAPDAKFSKAVAAALRRLIRE